MAEARKLAAIVATDVVGYGRLAGADEDRTLARLRALRSDLIDPSIAVHNGRVVKRTGDGSLVEFRSVVDAVRCAIEVQNGLVERNAGLPPERRIEFRVGIHLGHVVEESDGDLMGDGVNIAARLEAIAKPGTIWLSEDAYRQVRARLDLTVNDLGPTQLKNIAEPVRVYALEVGRAAPAKPIKTAVAPPLTKSLRWIGPLLAIVCAGIGTGLFVEREASQRAPTIRGVTDNEIRFGISAPFTGSARELGNQIKLGIETAFNLINDAGGIEGNRVGAVNRAIGGRRA